MSAVASQGLRFVLVGAALLALDATVFMLATFAGLSVALANPLSRALAAAAGYYAHRRLTFGAASGASSGAAERLRYVLVWLALTLISTQTLAAIAAHHTAAAVLVAKPLVEAVLALISFSLLKLWVYRQ